MKYITTFGSLPIGAVFTRRVRTRALSDRRRREFQEWHYTKKTHGTISGFADGPHGTWNPDLCSRVTIETDDHRVIVECVRACHAAEGAATTEFLIGLFLLSAVIASIIVVFALLGGR